MVSNSTLAALCVEHGLQKYLLYNSAALSNNIRDYLQALELAKAKEYEQAKLEERTPGQYWLDIDPPKVRTGMFGFRRCSLIESRMQALSDIVESIIGAVFVSDNCQHSGIEIVYQKLLQPFYERHISLKTLSHHPTKILFELFQSHGCTQFEILKEGEGNGSMKCEG